VRSTDTFKMTFSKYSSNRNGPLDLMYTFNYRPFLEHPDSDSLYLHQSYYNFCVRWDSFQEFQRASVATIAANMRLCCYQNKQPSSVKKALKFFEENIVGSLVPVSSDTRLDYSATITSWTTFEYNKLNFAAARDKNVPGTGEVIFTQPMTGLPLNIVIPPYFFTLKDGRGGYWIRATNFATGWKGHDL
jgi:hypothetical protein